MYFHTAFLFDYVSFAKEARKLAFTVEKNNLEPLHARATQIASQLPEDQFVFRNYGYGPWQSILPISAIQNSPYRNSEVGRLFFIVMSQYVKPASIVIGDSWAILKDALEVINWGDTDIRKLFFGSPIGLLITQQADFAQQISEVTHQDPYWRWIRPLYSFNQGGWLSKEECEQSFHLLNQVGPQIADLILLKGQELSGIQLTNWKNSLLQGYSKALLMLQEAFTKDLGLYLLILWDDINE